MRHWIHLVAILYNNFYLNVRRTPAAVEKLSALLQSFVGTAKLFNHVSKSRKTRIRVMSLFQSLVSNNAKCADLRFTDRRKLSDMIIVRLLWHLLGVVLACPPSPLSILFHTPLQYAKGYLLAMPEDQSASLLKAMANHGVWLCPNNHMYFVGNCTATTGTGNCPTCGEDVGNKKGGSAHTAAKGNRRIGRINADGKIIADKYGATEGTVAYEPAKYSPQGYVLIEGADDICRDLNPIHVRICRLFVNIIVLMHHSDFDNSDAAAFTKIAPADAPSVSRKLFDLVETYITKLKELFNNASLEKTVYILHAIIQRFYITFPRQSEKEQIKLTNVKKAESRIAFEKFIVSHCIKPVLDNIDQEVKNVRQLASSSAILHEWVPRFEERLDLTTTEGKNFQTQFHPNLFSPFQLITLSSCHAMVMKDDNNRTKYPTVYGVFKTMSESVGYSVFAVQFLPRMISWMKLIHSRFNQRLDQTEVETKASEYTAQMALDRCESDKWGDVDRWRNALDGFFRGWNHVARRVTTKDEKEGSHIYNAEEKSSADGDDNDEKDEFQFQPRDKEKFARFVAIQHECQKMPIEPIRPIANLNKGTSDNDIQPSDVALIWALDTGTHGNLQTSVMIRGILQHLVMVNNRALLNCLGGNDDNLDASADDAMTDNVNGDDNKEESKEESKSDESNAAIDDRNLNSEASMKHIDISRRVDIIDVDEDELLKIVQQCTLQKLRYGDRSDLSVNLPLLETRLKERYIVGRKKIQFTPEELVFEFAGQHNIPQLIDQINFTHARTNRKRTVVNVAQAAAPIGGISYFEEAPIDILDNLKLNLIQKADLANVAFEHTAQNMAAMQHRMVAHEPNARKLESYKNAKRAVEQTIIFLSRQLSCLPDATMQLLGDYMKDVLHLYTNEFDAFIRLDLKLGHTSAVWKYLQRLFLLEKGDWQMIPTQTLSVYQSPITPQMKTQLEQFIARHPLSQMWDFLLEWKRLLETTLTTQFPGNLALTPLTTYLMCANFNETYVDAFPQCVMVVHSAHAYRHAAKAYQDRAHREHHS